MGRGINKVFIIGNLGADPDIRYMQNGVVNISVATTSHFKGKNIDDIESKTEWHRIILYNKLGEIASNYLKKGSKVFIEGSLRTNKWKDKNGNDRYSVDIIANNMEILDKKDINYNLDDTKKKDTSNDEVIMENKKNRSKEYVKNNKNIFDEDIPF